MVQAEQMEPLLEEDEHLDKASGLSFTSSREDMLLTPAVTSSGASPLMSSSSNVLASVPSPGQLTHANAGTFAGVADAAAIMGAGSGSTSGAGSGASPQDTLRSDHVLPPGAAGSGVPRPSNGVNRPTSTAIQREPYGVAPAIRLPTLCMDASVAVVGCR